MFNVLTNNWNRHRLLSILKRKFEQEEWNSLVRAMTREEIEDFLNVTQAKLEVVIRDLLRSEEITAVDNRRAFLLNPGNGLRAINRQKYLQRIYRLAGIGITLVLCGCFFVL